MARSPFLSLDPNLDLPEMLKQIETERAGQAAGVERFGASQGSNIQQIYGQLQGDLQKGVGTVQSIYGNAAGNTQAAFDRAGTGAQGAAAQNMGAIGDFASSLGMDARALSEVQGKLATQAQSFEQRNRASSASRVGNLQQLGAGMASVAQLGVQASQQAEAQNRTDLSRKIQDHLTKITQAANSAKVGASSVKLQQAQAATASAQKGILQAQKELMAEERANRKEAAANARAAASAARSASRSGGRSGASGPDWMTKFMMQNEENDRRFARGQAAKGPGKADNEAAAKEYDKRVRSELGRGNAYQAFVEVVNGNKTWAEAQKEFKTPKGKKLNWDLIGRYVDEAP